MFGITKQDGIYTITFKNRRSVYTTKSLLVAIDTKFFGYQQLRVRPLPYTDNNKQRTKQNGCCTSLPLHHRYHYRCYWWHCRSRLHRCSPLPHQRLGGTSHHLLGGTSRQDYSYLLGGTSSQFQASAISLAVCSLRFSVLFSQIVYHTYLENIQKMSKSKNKKIFRICRIRQIKKIFRFGCFRKSAVDQSS